jgi:hypothetical protein
MTQPTPLQKRLERARFDRALAVSESLADHRALLTLAELSRLNLLLTGALAGPSSGTGGDDDPWRQNPVEIQLPSGKKANFNLMADPRVSVREKLHRATELAENGAVIDAAVEIYAGLVLLHPFKDANRRTAVLAAHYFLSRYGVPVSGLALHEIGLGDLREAGEIEALKETIRQIAKFASRRD